MDELWTMDIIFSNYSIGNVILSHCLHIFQYFFVLFAFGSQKTSYEIMVKDWFHWIYMARSWDILNTYYKCVMISCMINSTYAQVCSLTAGILYTNVIP